MAPMEVGISSKVCCICSVDKPVSEFYKDKDRSDGLYTKCKPCHNTISKNYAEKIKLQEKESVAEKFCVDCSTSKPISNFTKRKDTKSGYLSVCKPCRNKKTRAGNYIRRYGLDAKAAQELAVDRISICKICDTKTIVVVDHCHANGKVRGYLCYSCNTVLGLAKDNVDILKSAIDYLESNKE